MTGDPLSDRVATVVLSALALFVLVLCLPGAPATAPTPTPTARVTVQVEAPFALLEEGGLILDRQTWTWEGRTGTAWRARVPLTGSASVVPSGPVVPFASLLPTDAGPWAAINGGFYEQGAMGLVVADGVQHAALSPRGGSGVFQFGPQGPSVVHRDTWQAGAPHALQSIDRLVDQSKNLVNRREDAALAARSAVVVGRDAIWLVALAEDDSVQTVEEGGARLRGTSGRGLPLWAFAAYLIEQCEAREALNLDGAISTQLSARTSLGSFSLVGEAGTINALVLRP